MVSINVNRITLSLYLSSRCNSWTNLKIALFLLIGVPIILNIMYYYFAMKYGVPEDDENKAKESDQSKQSSKREDRVQLPRKR